jgi:hypothetical protein
MPCLALCMQVGVEVETDVPTDQHAQRYVAHVSLIFLTFLYF